MIRLRTALGKVLALPEEAAAVEVCSVDGKLARVLTIAADGKIILLGPQDAEFQKYARAVQAEVAELIDFSS